MQKEASKRASTSARQTQRQNLPAKSFTGVSYAASLQPSREPAARANSGNRTKNMQDAREMRECGCNADLQTMDNMHASESSANTKHVKQEQALQSVTLPCGHALVGPTQSSWESLKSFGKLQPAKQNTLTDATGQSACDIMQLSHLPGCQ